MIVPSIRQDLKLSEGPKKEDGSASWLLYDSLRNKYFSINKKAFDLLKNWSSGIETTEFIEKIKKSKPKTEQEELMEDYYKVCESYDEDLQSLFAVQDILSTADEYIFDDLETEQEYKNKIRGNNG